VVLYCLEIELGVTYRELIDWPEGDATPPAGPELKKAAALPYGSEGLPASEHCGLASAATL
jgi:hypothetical protein